MKTAIVCDWLVAVGGAEKFLGHLLQCFPEADVFAVVDFVADDNRDFLHNKKVHTTFIQKLPLAKRFYRSYLPLMPIAIEQLDVSAYDLIISSSHAVAKGVLTGPDQTHVSYVHSPMRYAWDLQHQYLHETNLDKKISGIFARIMLHKMRLWDARSAQNVDRFAANSKFIARRIQKTYRRHAEVIYPPIEIEKFKPRHAKDDFFLAISRLVPYKRMDLIVDSFKNLPHQKLIVIGDGPEFAKVKSKAGSNVELLGYQSNELVIDYMQRARALIFAAQEDFGLVPVEAQSCGTPVIAFGKGGALETVRGLEQENPTGIFFAEQTTDSICDAINLFVKNESQLTLENCVANANRFSPEAFSSKFKNFIMDAIRGNVDANS